MAYSGGQSYTQGKNVGDTFYKDGGAYRVIDPGGGAYEEQWGDPIWQTNPTYIAKKAQETQAENARKQDALIAQQKIDTANKEAAQKAEEEGYFNQYSQQIAGQETLPAMASRISGEIGLGNVREVAQGLVQTLKNLPSQIRKSKEGYMNANQVQGLISQRQGQLAPQVSDVLGTQSMLEQDLATQLGYGVQQQTKELQPIVAKGAMISDRMAREFTGFTQDKQNELDLIIKQAEAGNALTLQQMANANALALQEKQFIAKKYEIDNQQKTTQTSDLKTLSAGQTLVDASGKVIYQAPARATTSGGTWG